VTLNHVPNLQNEDKHCCLVRCDFFRFRDIEELVIIFFGVVRLMARSPGGRNRLAGGTGHALEGAEFCSSARVGT
jgi:hypothetical protein